MGPESFERGAGNPPKYHCSTGVVAPKYLVDRSTIVGDLDMWKPRLDVPLVLLAGALAFVRPAPVTACITDSERDNGDTCSVPDQCQGGTCVLGGGGDTNTDLICDDEFVAGLDLRVTKLIIRTFPAAGPASASMHGAGDFIDLVPPGPFSSSGGIAIRVKDVLSGVPPPGTAPT